MKTETITLRITRDDETDGMTGALTEPVRNWIWHELIDCTPEQVEVVARQYVYVHMWDGDNANVYGSLDAALDGITGSYEDFEKEAVRAALVTATENLGDAAYLDGGLGVVRYLSITNKED